MISYLKSLWAGQSKKKSAEKHPNLSSKKYQLLTNKHSGGLCIVKDKQGRFLHFSKSKLIQLLANDPQSYTFIRFVKRVNQGYHRNPANKINKQIRKENKEFYK